MKKWYTCPGRMAEVVTTLPHPERCGVRTTGMMGENVTIQEWPSRGALLKTIQMQGRREHQSRDWRLLVKEEIR